VARKAAEVVKEQVVNAPARPAVAKPFVALEEVLGQERAVQTLLTAAATGHLHHAWIFHGPPGVGKFTTAAAFAALVLDPTTAPDLSGRIAPDPDSQTQRLVRAGTHPDLHIVTRELAAISEDPDVRDRKQLNIPKPVLKEFLIEPAARARVLSGASNAGKVFIVDEAELMDGIGQNALLKTLEEPPPGTVIILVTAREHRLLPTIRSRCQRVAFSPLEEKDMRAWLKRVNPQPPPPREQIDWVLSFACGSPGAAELALANNLFQWHVALAPMFQQLARGEFPIEMGEVMTRLIKDRAEAVVKGNAQASLDAVKRAWARRLLSLLSEQIRRDLRESTARVARASLPVTGHEAADAGKRGASQPPTARALSQIDVLAEAEPQLNSNVNLEMLLENVAAQLAAEPQPV
jgi:DNA polymerase-3 subunit delta'